MAIDGPRTQNGVMNCAPVRHCLVLAALFVSACSSTGDIAPAPVADAPAAETLAETFQRIVPGPDGVEVQHVSAPPSSARIEDLDFLVGRWVGEAFGGTAEEAWTPILGGQMLGTFRLVQDGAPVFSEHMLLAVLDGRPALRLKHFDPQLVGWEEKDGFVEFDLLDAVPGRSAHLDGLTFIRSGDALDIYLALETPDGSRVEHLQFQRSTR